MEFKAKILKNIFSVICATVVAMSGVVTSVGAVDEVKLQQILANIDDCDRRIKKISGDKEKINESKAAEINKLDIEIKRDEESFNKLLEKLADMTISCQEEYKILTDNIEKNKQNKAKISNDIAKEINKLDELIKQSKAEKDRLEVELNKLLNQQDIIHKPNAKIQTEHEFANMWKQVSSGCQYDPTGKYESLCWLMSTRNVLNFFDVEEEPARNPIQGVQNVIDNYLNRGGILDHIKKNDMQDDIDIREWLNKNQISTLHATNCALAGDFNNNDAKKKLIEIVKEQIMTHFDISNARPSNRMSPIIAGGHGHWLTIVGYYKNTDNVIIVDSLNGYKNESKISVVNIDKLIEEKLITNQGEALIIELIFTAKRNNVNNLDEFISSYDAFCGQKIVKDHISQSF